jgi:hypothetical protein
MSGDEGYSVALDLSGISCSVNDHDNEREKTENGKEYTKSISKYLKCIA